MRNKDFLSEELSKEVSHQPQQNPVSWRGSSGRVWTHVGAHRGVQTMGGRGLRGCRCGLGWAAARVRPARRGGCGQLLWGSGIVSQTGAKGWGQRDPHLFLNFSPVLSFLPSGAEGRVSLGVQVWEKSTIVRTA